MADVKPKVGWQALAHDELFRLELLFIIIIIIIIIISTIATSTTININCLGTERCKNIDTL